MASAKTGPVPLLRAIQEHGDDIPDLLTADEVAALVGKSAMSVYRYISQGQLRAVREPVTDRWLIKKDDLISFVTPSGDLW